MGFFDRLLGRSDGPPAHLTPNETRVGSWHEWAQVVAEDLHGSTPAKLYREQPHLRTVVSFVSRNTAQLGLHVYERSANGDRKRARGSLLSRVLASCDGVMTTYELVYATVGDLSLYDRAHWYVAPSSETSTGWIIRRIPPSWVRPESTTAFAVKSWRVTYGKESVVIPAENMLSFTGYSPTDPRVGSPTVEALRQTLQEQIEAALYRSQVWKRGGRVSSVLQRPKDAPEWSDAARAAFSEDWYSKFTGRGSKAGGTPILEDGMTLNRIDFNAKEQQFVEASKLSMTTVAAAFHINPTMVGQNEGATYSNVREFRKMLYGDTLGPLVAQIESRINAFLLPMLGVDPETFYVEFNIDEKLQGNFEEQSAAMQTATGAPWMTRNEARAIRNLPQVEGGDELVVPLNVLVGGQASPRDGVTAGGGSGGSVVPAATEPAPSLIGGYTPDEVVKLIGAVATLIRSGFAPEAAMEAVGLDPVEHLGLLPVTVQRPAEVDDPDEEIADALKSVAELHRAKDVDSLRVKARAPGTHEAKYEQVLSAFFERQGRAVRGALGQKDGRDWWDADKWDDELSGELLSLSALTSEEVGRRTAKSLGFDEGEYGVDQTLAYLRKVARTQAEGINEVTRSQVDDALDSDDDSSGAVSHVFEVAVGARAAQAAVSLVTEASAFAAVEAGKQLGGSNATKTWITTSGNPRPSHAAMDGETVPVDDLFSNSLMWPGSTGDPDEVAGCQCEVRINVPD